MKKHIMMIVMIIGASGLSDSMYADSPDDKQSQDFSTRLFNNSIKQAELVASLIYKQMVWTEGKIRRELTNYKNYTQKVYADGSDCSDYDDVKVLRQIQKMGIEYLATLADRYSLDSFFH